MSTHPYDYAIIGAGAAGLHLAIKMVEDVYFQQSRILIIDKDEKTANDHTWSFWERGSSRWDALTEGSWAQGIFCGTDGEKFILDLQDYNYKTIRSSTFYSYAKAIVKAHPKVTWITDEVKSAGLNNVEGKEHTYQAHHIFDSRVDPTYLEKKQSYASLDQHFLGWFIRTEKPVFDSTTFTMMDYRLRWKDHTSFTYVLPFSPTYALVEFTLFNNEMLTKAEYENHIQTYIQQYLNIDAYTIDDTEYGVIPMSDYPFTSHHRISCSKIGTAGGWVRPSSGYSFKNGDRYAAHVVENIKQGKSPHRGIAKNRHRWYDSIFLRVLKAENQLGPEIFKTLYTKHSIPMLFRFLDERSSLIDDLKIMHSLDQPAFRKALLKR